MFGTDETLPQCVQQSTEAISDLDLPLDLPAGVIGKSIEDSHPPDSQDFPTPTSSVSLALSLPMPLQFGDIDTNSDFFIMRPENLNQSRLFDPEEVFNIGADVDVGSLSEAKAFAYHFCHPTKANGSIAMTTRASSSMNALYRKHPIYGNGGSLRDIYEVSSPMINVSSSFSHTLTLLSFFTAHIPCWRSNFPSKEVHWEDAQASLGPYSLS